MVTPSAWESNRRELEVLEKVAAGGKPQVVLAERNLGERVVNLL